MMLNIEPSQPRTGPPLGGAGKGFFHCHLYQVVRIGDVAGDDAGEAPQPATAPRRARTSSACVVVLMIRTS